MPPEAQIGGFFMPLSLCLSSYVAGTKINTKKITSCNKENDDVFILFGGSGSELVLCQQLKRNFISCELHPDYYSMIQSRFKNGGKIEDKYRLECAKRKQAINLVKTERTK